MHVRRTLLRAATAAACAASLVVTAAPGVSAGATDLALAVAETETAIALSAADAARANVENPEVTCANPTPLGSLVVPPVHVPNVVSVSGQDQAEGEGHCVSLQSRSYSVSLVVVVEAWHGPGQWNPIEACVSSNERPSAAGVGVAVVIPFLCPYDAAGAAAGKPHRAHAILKNSVTGVEYHGYSQVYLTPQEDDLADLGQS